jgi:hypothetical protein
LHLIYSPIYPSPPPEAFAEEMVKLPPSGQDSSDGDGNGGSGGSGGSGGAGMFSTVGFVVEASPNLAGSLWVFQKAMGKIMAAAAASSTSSLPSLNHTTARTLSDSHGNVGSSGDLKPMHASASDAAATAATASSLPKAHRAPAVRRAMQVVMGWAARDAKAAMHRRGMKEELARLYKEKQEAARNSRPRSPPYGQVNRSPRREPRKQRAPPTGAPEERNAATEKATEDN